MNLRGALKWSEYGEGSQLRGGGWKSGSGVLEGGIVDRGVAPGSGPHVVGEGVEGVGKGAVEIMGSGKATRYVWVTSLKI